MSNWQDIKLGNAGKVVTGKTPSKDNPEDWGEDVLFITPSDYKNYRKKAYSSIRMLSKIGADRQKNRILPSKSILVTCIGSDMGKTVVNALPCVSNQQINAITPNELFADSDYIYYVTKDLYETLRSLGGDGTAVPILNKSDFENIDISLLSLPEQKTIAAVLSSLDDKIDLLHRQNQTLEAMAETLFRQWFVEEAQENWGEKHLSFFGEIICGKTPSKKSHRLFGGDIPFIKIPDMHGNVFIFKTEDSLTEEGKNSQANKTLPERSICVSCIATVGLVSITTRVSQTNQQINSIVPRHDFYRYFLYLTLKSSYDLLHALASGGTATLNLNTGNFSKIAVPFAGDKAMKQFSDVVDPLFNKIYTNQSQIHTLEKLRDTLLPKLMTGEVRVAC